MSADTQLLGRPRSRRDDHAVEHVGASTWRRFGRFEILPLVDAVGPFFESVRQAFPTASSAALAAARQLDPAAMDAAAHWQLRFRCFAVRQTNGRIHLVDAGIGPVDSPAASWTPVPGRLPQLLVEAGIELSEIDAVVLTHLHSDHVGWAVVQGHAHFPNARYIMQRAEALAVKRLDPRMQQVVLDPLAAAGRVQLLDGNTRLAHGLTAIPTPGHTPGHQSVRVTSRGDEALLTGDLLVHAVQLADPTVAYRFESDPETAQRSRVRMLRQAVLRGALLGTAHLGEHFVPVTRSDAARFQGVGK